MSNRSRCANGALGKALGDSHFPLPSPYKTEVHSPSFADFLVLSELSPRPPYSIVEYGGRLGVLDAIEYASLFDIKLESGARSRASK